MNVGCDQYQYQNWPKLNLSISIISINPKYQYHLINTDTFDTF